LRPKPATATEIERLAFALGFIETRSKGSHHIYHHPDGRRTTISFHRGEVASGTVKSIIKEMGITVDQFNENI
jgi:predicted RNA binding protein YcfA (HicA-like mRNA interferase family)